MMVYARMPLQTCMEFPERPQLMDGEIAAARQRAVQDRRDMAVGEEEQVFALAVHAESMRLMLHDIKIQHCKIIGTAQRTARMAGFRPVYHADDIPSDLAGGCFQFCGIKHFNKDF